MPIQYFPTPSIGQLGFYPFNKSSIVDDESGAGNDLEIAGSLSRVLTPQAPTTAGSVGVFSASNYLKADYLSTPLVGSTTWTIAGYFYFNNLAVATQLWSFKTGGAATNLVSLHSLTTGVRLYTNGSFTDATGIMSSNLWYRILINYDSPTLNICVSPASSAIDDAADGTRSDASAILTDTFYAGREPNFWFGRSIYPDSPGALNGYMKDLYVSTQTLLPSQVFRI